MAELESARGHAGSGNHTNSSRSRSRRLFIYGAVLVLAIGGFFAYEVTRALYVRSHTGSVFNTYVIQHHIGQAQISDDSSGFQLDFCVLHLTKPIPQSELEFQTFSLMQKYHELDGGISMTLVYADPSTGKTVTEATAQFLPQQGIVSMTLGQGDIRRTVTRKVNWNTNS